MPGYTDALSEIDSALAQYGGPPPGPPPSSSKAAVTGSYEVEADDVPPIRFATPSQIANVRPIAPAPSDRPAYLSGLDTIDRALAAAPSTDAGPPAAEPDAAVPAKPKWSDIPADVATQIVAGTDKGALTLAGLPGDAQRAWNTVWDRAALGAVHKGFDWTGYGPQAGTPERDEFDRGWSAMNDVGSAAAGPQNIPTGADLTKGFEAVGGKLPDPRTTAGDYARTVGEFIPGAGRNLVTGALLPGLASEAAGQATKDTGLEPYARVAGGVAGALGGAIVPHALKPVAAYAEPLTGAGQEAIAARTLGNATTDVPAARAALDQPSEIVPGSMPTTFQQTGDLGLGQLERKQRMNEATAPAYIDRDRAQNAARVNALQDIQQTGSPADVAAQFRQVREALDQQAQDSIDALRPAAEDANAAMGGHGTADSTGYALRQPMADARADVKDNEDQLWSLVNQDAGVPTNGISQIARDTKNAVSQSATPMSGEEARIFNVAAGYPSVQRFGDLKDLRSSITDATAEARAANRAQTVRRLTILRQALDNALDHGVENQVALEQIAVKRGLMSPEQTFEVRLARERQQFLQDRAAQRTGQAAGSDLGANVSGRSSGIPPTSRTQSEGRAGFRNASGDSGVQESRFSDFTPEDVANYLAAKKATRTRAETFDEGVAGKVLQPAGRGGYEMPDAAVPAALVPSGKPTDALAVRQFMAAGGTPEAIADATAYSIRSYAKRLDGTLDPNKVHSWLNRNQEALAAMPPEVANRFRNVADSQAAVDEMVAKQEAKRAAFNQTAIARIAGLQHGEDVVKTIGGIFGQKDAVQQFQMLAKAASADPSARDGLRRAIVEHLLGRLTSNASNNASGISQIKGDSFIGYMKHNGAALRQVFEPRELDMMAGIGNDLDRALRTHQTKGLTTSPGTAQDLGAAKGSILSELGEKVGPAGLAMVSHAAGANVLTSALGFLGAQTIGRMRAAGIATANDMVVKAMLDPALAKKLLAKVPDRPGQGTARALGDQFVRLSRATAAGEFASMSDRSRVH